ncbi:MAG: hypothetical protein IT308_05045 [Anaerolineaceae bacterium]|nr:hypothetical protein [Anaerolineaceae bacterium]
MIKRRFQTASIPIAISLLVVAAYGLLIPWMGFYWDDWTFAWISHFLGPGEFIEAFKPFRPFLGPIFTVTTSLFGENPLAWQVFAVILRALTGIAVWWSFGKIWPQRKREVALLSLAFVVFPGYLSQWVAFTHSNQELISLLAYLLSFGVMALALQPVSRCWPLTLGALALMFIGLFPTEYFFGLELLRPIILWFMLEPLVPRAGKRFVQTTRYWAPYLTLWLANAVWLYSYQRSGAYESYDIQAFDVLQLPPLKLVLNILEEGIQALATAGFAAWTRPFQLLVQPLGVLSNLLPLALAGACFMGLFLYLGRMNFPELVADKQKTPWAAQAVLLGVLGILVGRIPSWLAGLPLAIEFSWDRFMLSTMLGGSLLLAGLIEFFIKSDLRKTMLFSLLIALAVGRQFATANTFRRDWENQRQFFWQLAWRIPSLKPGTVLATHELPLVYESDFNLTAPLNWIYSPVIESKDLSYMMIYTRARLGSDLLPKVQAGLPVKAQYRTMTFQGSTSDMVVFYHPVPGCVRVLDDVYAGKETTPGLTYMLTDAIPLSNLTRIRADAAPAVPPANLFGEEPAHGWCYYFEKAELARQRGDWQTAAVLGDEAAANGLSALAPVEWLPFIEAYARTGNLAPAAELTQKVHETNKDLDPALCSLWARAAGQDGAAEELKSRAAATGLELGCQP